jgi:hypothetical protein
MASRSGGGGPRDASRHARGGHRRDAIVAREVAEERGGGSHLGALEEGLHAADEVGDAALVEDAEEGAARPLDAAAEEDGDVRPREAARLAPSVKARPRSSLILRAMKRASSHSLWNDSARTSPSTAGCASVGFIAFSRRRGMWAMKSRAKVTMGALERKFSSRRMVRAPG